MPKPITRRACITALAASVTANADSPQFEQIDVFRAGSGFHTFRIPSLLSTRRGMLLAFAEGRRQSRSDSGEICIVMKRSADQGRTWSELRTIAERGGDTIGNPCPVQDQFTGRIYLPLTCNPGNVTESQIIRREVEARRTVYLTSSDDDGLTWSALRDITSAVRKPHWTWYATGPGIGIQTRTGRLVIPCDHNEEGQEGSRSHVFYSDDHGMTWQLGGETGTVTNECQVAELRDGALLLNMRSGGNGGNRRGVARSTDGGLTWSEVRWDDALVEPVCQASLLAVRGVLYFSNPASKKRERMTVRTSHDAARTWSSGLVLHEGPAAYSCLAALRGGKLGCLYECGQSSPYERIVLARFPARLA